jgi:hypothetical protein
MSEPLSTDGTSGQNFLIARPDFHDRRVALSVRGRSSVRVPDSCGNDVGGEMDIVLGVSMTPTTVHMVVVDGEKADGATVEHDTFDIGSAEGTPTSSATDHVLAAIMGTREGAVASGHRLVSTGVTWSDHANAAELRQALADRRIDGVTFVSQLHAAGALAQAAGSLFGYDKPALLLVEPDSATVAVVDMTDAAVIKVDSQPLTDADTAPVLTDMLSALKGHPSSPDGMFVIGSGRDLSAVIEQANEVLSIPVSAPADGELALARGAALGAADVGGLDPPTAADLSGLEQPTAALAYSQDTDALSATAAGVDDAAYAQVSADGQRAGKPFVLVGSAMAAIFTVGVISLVITLAVSIRPTADSLPGPAFGAAPPFVAPKQAPVPPSAMPPAPPPAAAVPTSVVPPPPPALEANVAPPTAAQAPVPRHAVVPAPAPEAAQPPPEAAQPPPAAPPPADAAPAPPVAAVPDNPQTGYPPAYGPAYGPGPGYAPAYGPGPGYGQQPAIPLIPGILGIGPAPFYRGPDRWEQPRWPSGPGYAPGRRGGGAPPWLWPGG